MDNYFDHFLQFRDQFNVKAQVKPRKKKRWILIRQYLQPFGESVDEEASSEDSELPRLTGKAKLKLAFEAAKYGMREGVLTGIFLGGCWGIIKNLTWAGYLGSRQHDEEKDDGRNKKAVVESYMVLTDPTQNFPTIADPTARKYTYDRMNACFSQSYQSRLPPYDKDKRRIIENYSASRKLSDLPENGHLKIVSNRYSVSKEIPLKSEIPVFYDSKSFFRRRGERVEIVGYAFVQTNVSKTNSIETKDSKDIDPEGSEKSSQSSKTNVAGSSQSEQRSSKKGSESVKSEINSSKKVSESIRSEIDSSKKGSESAKSEINSSKKGSESIRSEIDPSKKGSESIRSEIDPSKKGSESIRSEIDSSKKGSESIKSEIRSSKKGSSSVKSHSSKKASDSVRSQPFIKDKDSSDFSKMETVPELLNDDGNQSQSKKEKSSQTPSMRSETSSRKRELDVSRSFKKGQSITISEPSSFSSKRVEYKKFEKKSISQMSQSGSKIAKLSLLTGRQISENIYPGSHDSLIKDIDLVGNGYVSEMDMKSYASQQNESSFAEFGETTHEYRTSTLESSKLSMYIGSQYTDDSQRDASVATSKSHIKSKNESIQTVSQRSHTIPSVSKHESVHSVSRRSHITPSVSKHESVHSVSQHEYVEVITQPESVQEVSQRASIAQESSHVQFREETRSSVRSRLITSQISTAISTEESTQIASRQYLTEYEDGSRQESLQRVESVMPLSQKSTTVIPSSRLRVSSTSEAQKSTSATPSAQQAVSSTSEAQTSTSVIPPPRQRVSSTAEAEKNTSATPLARPTVSFVSEAHKSTSATPSARQAPSSTSEAHKSTSATPSARQAPSSTSEAHKSTSVTPSARQAPSSTSEAHKSNSDTPSPRQAVSSTSEAHKSTSATPSARQAASSTSEAHKSTSATPSARQTVSSSPAAQKNSSAAQSTSRPEKEREKSSAGFGLFSSINENVLVLSACNCAIVLGVICSVISTTRASLTV